MNKEKNANKQKIENSNKGGREKRVNPSNKHHDCNNRSVIEREQKNFEDETENGGYVNSQIGDEFAQREQELAERIE